MEILILVWLLFHVGCFTCASKHNENVKRQKYSASTEKMLLVFWEPIMVSLSVWISFAMLYFTIYY